MKSLLLIITTFLIVSAASAQGLSLKELTKNDTTDIYYKGDKPYSGNVYLKHTNGTIGLMGVLKDGKRVGKWIYRYSTGEKKRESTYIDNKKEGLTYYWYKNGQKAKEIMYRDGKNIDQKLWHEDGTRKPNPTFLSTY